MDVDYLRYSVVASDAALATSIQYMKQVGMAASAAEHTVPEGILKNPNLPTNDPTQVQGVSAARALGIAASEGQKIYALNKNNQSLHHAILADLQINQEVKSEIFNALAMGKEITVHEKDVFLNGWIGSGYVILDPETGAGAYKINGGGNGSDTPLPATLPGLLLGLLGGVAAIVMSPGILAGIAGAAAFLAVQLLNKTYDLHDKTNFAAGRFIGIISGMVLAIILGQYVLFSLTPLFLISLAVLMLTLIQLLILEIMTAFNSFYSSRRYV